MKRVSLSNVVIGVVLLVMGYSCREPGETVVLNSVRVDTVAPAAMTALLENAVLENAGLRAKLRGYESRPPRQIVRTDTLISPPDTVLQLVRVDGRSLITAPLIKADSLYAPELHRFDVGDCDDGWSWSAGVVVCDRARFGHLSAYVEAGAELDPFGTTHPTAAVRLGLQWTPSYRSPWRASLVMAPTGRLTAAIGRSWQLF